MWTVVVESHRSNNPGRSLWEELPLSCVSSLWRACFVSPLPSRGCASSPFCLQTCTWCLATSRTAWTSSRTWSSTALPATAPLRSGLRSPPRGVPTDGGGGARRGAREWGNTAVWRTPGSGGAGRMGVGRPVATCGGEAIGKGAGRSEMSWESGVVGDGRGGVVCVWRAAALMAAVCGRRRQAGCPPRSTASAGRGWVAPPARRCA